MIHQKTAVFIGHRECSALSPAQVRDAIESLIRLGVTDFLCGGMGGFDWLCARQTYELKRRYPHIRCHLVLPYRSFRPLEPGYFDHIFCPRELESYHYKAAIPARNRYMVDRSAYALCYVTHNSGGAARTYAYAVMRHLTRVHLTGLPFEN